MPDTKSNNFFKYSSSNNLGWSKFFPKIDIAIANNYLKEQTNLSEGKQYAKGFIEKNLTFGDIAKKVLKNLYLNLSWKYGKTNLDLIEFEMKLFWNDFQKANRYELLFLETAASSIKKYITELKDKKVDSVLLKNFVIVAIYDGKLPDDVPWEKNACAIFFDLQFQKIKVEKFQIERQNFESADAHDRNFGKMEDEITTILFKPKRMQFLDVGQKETNAKVVHTNEIKIHFVDESKHEDYSNKKLETAIRLLRQMDKIVNYKDPNFKNNFRLNEWFDFVSAFNDFNNTKNKHNKNNNYQEYNPVCLIDDNTEKFKNKLLIFTDLLNKKNFSGKNTKLILNQTAYDNPYINIKEKENVKFTNYLTEQENSFDKKISDINLKIEKLDTQIKQQKHEFELSVEKIENEINKHHEQEKKLQERLNEKQNILELTKQKLDKETSKLTSIEQERSKWKLSKHKDQQNVVETYKTKKEQLQKKLKFRQHNIRNLEQQYNKKVSESNALKGTKQKKDDRNFVTKQNELKKELNTLKIRKTEFDNDLQKIRIELEQTDKKLQSEINKLNAITQERKNWKLSKYKDQQKLVQNYKTQLATTQNQIKQLDEQYKYKSQAVKNDQIKLKNLEKEHNEKINKLNADKISLNDNLNIVKNDRDRVVTFLTKLVKWKKCQEKIYVASSFEITEKPFDEEQDKENNDKSNYFKKMLKTYPHIFLSKSASKDISLFQSKAPFLDSSNIGLLTKFKRYDRALWNTKQGYYKNPYMLSSLFHNTVIEIRKPLDNTIITKYELNEKQQKVVEKALNTRDIFYLQGPPGTGKTQTISAITECILQNNENVLMTSSTHEAINNFLDRLDKNVQNNPNVFMYKMDALNSDKDNNYDADSLYDKFIERVGNHIRRLSTTENEKKTLEIVNFLKKIPDRSKNHFYSDNYIANYMENLQKTSSGSNSVANFRNPDFEKFIKHHYKKDINDFCKISWPVGILQEDLKSRVEEAFEPLILASEINVNNSTQSDYFTKLNNHPITDKLTNLEDIYQDLQNAESFDWLDKQMQAYHQKIKSTASSNSREIQARKKEFIEWLFENEYINVIGLTTTSKTNLQIGNLEKDVYLEYEIDTVIIDEISKSNTPEIFSRINFANKIIFSGDYMQLPPTAELNEDELKNFAKRLINYYSQSKKDQKYGDLIKSLHLNNLFENRYGSRQNDYDNFSIIDENYLYKKVKDSLNNLLCTPFFKNQILSLKEKAKNKKISEKKWNYDYLKIQYRFNEDINKLVNVFYKDNESLSCAQNNQKKLNLNLFHLPKNRGIYLFDTSYLSKKFLAEYGNKFDLDNVKSPFPAFDQNDSVLRQMKNVKEKGQLNDYNAYCIEKIINYLISKNPNEKFINDIGVICLTINQKNNVRLALSKYSKYKIKVDTIDNFQGREKKIIIVDFVRAEKKYVRNTQKSGFQNSDKSRILDFLKTKERINVALSRAKNKLILVGAFRYYNENIKEKWFKDIIKIFENNRDLIFPTNEGDIF